MYEKLAETFRQIDLISDFSDQGKTKLNKQTNKTITLRKSWQLLVKLGCKVAQTNRDESFFGVLTGMIVRPN